MFSTLCCAAALFAPLEQAPAPARDLQLFVRVLPTQIFALNPTDQPELMVLDDREHGLTGHVVVPAHGVYQASFPALALQGLELQLVAQGASGLVVCGRWSLEGLRDNTHDFVWFDAAPGDAHAWSRTAHGWELLDEHGCSASFDEHTPCAPPACLAPHVPVVTPTDGSSGDLPPRVQREPPPPI